MLCQANSAACGNVAYNDDQWQYGPHSKSTPSRKCNTCWRTYFIVVFLLIIVTSSIPWVIVFARVAASMVVPTLFIRLVGVEGLDSRASPSEPLAFHLAIDADGVAQRYHSCGGGGNSMLRVSYHGMILAWGHVPGFRIHGGGGTWWEEGLRCHHRRQGRGRRAA
ncbi:hypothetical protein PVAP13_5NG408340 [Panicum virgatum]|uniref:Uncharacterized protein n=1 Tax=Panicum virgatum TaxID=38727 RepID=A0A8T0S142_PANVG|nr:hypothetical protein PVAP13_5NG408340 [Panicum virgatum]